MATALMVALTAFGVGQVPEAKAQTVVSGQGEFLNWSRHFNEHRPIVKLPDSVYGNQNTIRVHSLTVSATRTLRDTRNRNIYYNTTNGSAGDLLSPNQYTLSKSGTRDWTIRFNQPISLTKGLGIVFPAHTGSNRNQLSDYSSFSMRYEQPGPAGPADQRWNQSAEYGTYEGHISQGSQATLTAKRTLNTAGTLSGPVVVRVQNQNSYDVEGGEPAELIIRNGSGRVVHRISATPYNPHRPVSSVADGSQGNGWGGVQFALPQDFQLDAGSTVEARVRFGARSSGSPVVNSQLRSPTGPGEMTFNYHVASAQDERYPVEHGETHSIIEAATDPMVTVRRTIDTEGTITGPIDARVASKNGGYDLHGGHPSSVRIVGPDGRVLYDNSANPGGNRVHPIHNWGGARFDLPSPIDVPAGSYVEVKMPFRDTGAAKENPRIQGPIGPASVDFEFTRRSSFAVPNQRQAVCVRPMGSDKITGVTIAPNSDVSREIKEVQTVGLYSGGVQWLSNVNAELIQSEGGKATISVSPELDNATYCFTIVFDADAPLSGTDFHGAFEYDVLSNAGARDSAFQNTVINPPADWKDPKVENPALPQRCGQNIAIVMDASNSIKAKGGIDATMNSALGVVRTLQGTATSVGIYNYGSFAPRFNNAQIHSTPIDTPEGTRRVEDAITNYGRGLRTDIRSNVGATNWEAALQQISDYNTANQGNTYDIVYFITDGFPTFATTEPVGGAEQGGSAMMHASDLTMARNAADVVKRQGTHVKPIIVNIPRDTREVVAKDSTVAMNDMERYYRERDKAPGHVYNVWGGGDAFFAHEHIERRSMDVNTVEPNTTLGRSFGDPLAADRSFPANPENVRNHVGQPDFDTWAVTAITPEEAGDVISGPGQTLVVEQFADLERELANLALANCDGTVTLNKNIVDHNGENLEDERLAGWQFRADTDGNYLVNRTQSGTNLANSVRSTTNIRGQVEFNLEMDHPDQVIPVRIFETPVDGYTLFAQGTPENPQNAVCTVNYTDDRPATQMVVKNLDQGFSLEAHPGEIITCNVSNQKDPQETKLQIIKLDQDQNELSGSEFKVFGSNAEGTVDESNEVWSSADANPGTLKAGTYYLREVKAPAGFALIPGDIRFEVTAGPGGLGVRIDDHKLGGFIVGNRVELTPVDQTVILEVANVFQGYLPKTGGIGVGSLIVMGLALIIGGGLSTRRKFGTA